jgi:Icc-related predicted phosphoesterase
MKLLLFSDLHANAAAARSLVERSKNVDVVVGAGDFAVVRRRIQVAIEVLKAIDRPAILVAGNNETTEELTEACRGWPKAHVLHGSSLTIDGVPFFGLGGGVPVTPFGAWSYDFTEEQAGELLAPCPAGCVLVSHSPPKGAADVSSSGRTLGSTAVRDAALGRQAVLVVCGHIHESAGRRAMIGNTPVVNAGPGGMEWEIPA